MSRPGRARALRRRPPPRAGAWSESRARPSLEALARTRPPEKPRRKSGVVFLETPPPKAKSPLALQAAAPAELRPRSGAAILAPLAAPEPDVAALLRAQAAAFDAQRDALAALAAKVDALLDRPAKVEALLDRRPGAADDGGGREFLPGA